ncbi:MAG: restriction endonuclease subunit S [bacterium]|nr:restriction endonuclease subunit S [bacterium]
MTTLMQTIPKGYKQTEVGVIPADWDVKEMKDFTLSVASGKSKTTNESGDYPIYGSTGIIGKRKQADYSGDKILIARVGANAGTVNKVSGKYCVSDNTLMVTYPPEIDINFSYYQLINFRINKIIFGSGQPLVTGGQIKSLVFAIPSNKKEQSAIATALSDADALIEKLEKLIEKKKNIKHGAMQELLTGKRRLSGFSAEWEGKKLGDLFSLAASYSKSKFINDGGTYLIMDMGSVSSVGKNISSKRTFLSSDLLKTGDLVMPKDDIGGGNIIGKVAYVDRNDKYILGDHVYKLTAKTPEISTLFFSYLINSNAVSIRLKKKVAGSAQLGLGRKSVEDEDVDFPKDKDEQISIASVLSDMDTEIEKLESQLTKYQNLKQGMMQVLLTGKIRLLSK